MQTLQNDEVREEFLEQVMMFSAMHADTRRILQNVGELIEFEEGELIIADGDLSPSFFVILDGTVKVHVPEDGNDVYICSLGKGATFGESSLFLKMPRTANVTALEKTVLFKITRFEIMRFIRNYPSDGNRFLMVIIYQLMKKLREVNRELAFERRTDSDQLEVDALIAELSGNN